MHVIGAYAGGDPVTDARTFEEDLMLADLQVLQNRIERLEASVKKNRPDREEAQEELLLLHPSNNFCRPASCCATWNSAPTRKRSLNPSRC